MASLCSDSRVYVYLGRCLPSRIEVHSASYIYMYQKGRKGGGEKKTSFRKAVQVR